MRTIQGNAKFKGENMYFTNGLIRVVIYQLVQDNAENNLRTTF